MPEIIVNMKKDYIKVKGGEYKQDLIRCKDCKHCMIFNNGEPECSHHNMIVDDYYFCADGEEGRWTP